MAASLSPTASIPSHLRIGSQVAVVEPMKRRKKSEIGEMYDGSEVEKQGNEGDETGWKRFCRSFLVSSTCFLDYCSHLRRYQPPLFFNSFWTCSFFFFFFFFFK